MFDPRSSIITVLKAYKPSGQENTGIVFHTERGDEQLLGIHLWEGEISKFEEGGKLGFSNPNMVLLSLISSVARNVHIGGGRRNHVALIDVHVFLVKDDRWKIETVCQEVSNNIESCIRASEKSVTGCIFVECINCRDLDPLKQTLGKRRIIGIRAIGDYD
jgi:hypothetical protein